jgi:hypothetical protein
MTLGDSVPWGAQMGTDDWMACVAVGGLGFLWEMI